MTAELISLNNNYLLRDHEFTWRWYDGWGENVRKWFLDASKVVSTTTAVGSTVTVTNGTFVSVDSVTGGALTITLVGGDNDKLEAQSVSEDFYFGSAWPAYFGCKVGQFVDADQTDMHFGFIIRDTDIAGGVTNGIYFRVVDESAVLSFVIEKGSAETTTEIVTTAESTDYTLEFYYDGAGYVHAYLNGALVTSVATSNANFPNTEHLCATIAVQCGEGSANNARLYWARAIQVQAKS